MGCKLNGLHSMAARNLQLGCTAGVPFQMRRWKIGHGDSAIFKTIKHMETLVSGPEGVGNPQVRIAAVQAVRGAIKNVNEIDFVLAWVKSNIEFRGENAETLQSPVVTLRLMAGDCDDHSILLAAILRSLGYNTMFKTVATDRANPGQFSHVYVVVRDKRSGQWRPVDSTVKKSFVGWEPPMAYRTKTYPARRRRGGLGDDTLFQPLVPFPSAPVGLSPIQQFAYNIAEPLTQAYASQIAHGQTPAVTGNLNLGLNSSGGGGLPTWAWLLFGGGLIFLIVRSR
jgi:Transglutaminase-like superfamily